MSLNFQKEEEERFLLWVAESWYPLYKEKRQGIIARISMNRGGKNLKNAHYFSNLNKVKVWLVPPSKDETIIKINTRKRKNEFLILDERLSMETARTLEVTLSSVEEKFANLHNPKVKDIDELPDKDVLERIKEFRDDSIIRNKASLYNELALSYVITIYILRHDWLLKDDPKSWFINSFQFGKDLLSINKILQVYNNEDYGFSFKGLMIILESKKNVLDSFDWIPPKWLKYLEEHLPETLYSENEKSESKEKAVGEVLAESNKVEKKPTKHQKYKKLFRDCAAKLWETDTKRTIVSVVADPELNSIQATLGMKKYKLRTIYGYIKDLCPNRKPGRRSPKKK